MNNVEKNEDNQYLTTVKPGPRAEERTVDITRYVGDADEVHVDQVGSTYVSSVGDATALMVEKVFFGPFGAPSYKSWVVLMVHTRASKEGVQSVERIAQALTAGEHDGYTLALGVAHGALRGLRWLQSDLGSESATEAPKHREAV